MGGREEKEPCLAKRINVMLLVLFQPTFFNRIIFQNHLNTNSDSIFERGKRDIIAFLVNNYSVLKVML
jgi:hypothetical protein